MELIEKYPYLRDRPANVRAFVRLRPNAVKLDFEAPFAWFEFSETSEDQVWELHTGAGPTPEMLHAIFGQSREDVELFFDKNFPIHFDRELSFPLSGGVSSISLLAAMHLNPIIESFTFMWLDSGTIYWYGKDYCTRCYFSEIAGASFGETMRKIHKEPINSDGEQNMPVVDSTPAGSFWRKLLPFQRANS